MELKRVLFSKKTLLALILFLVLSCWFYVKEQTKDLESFSEINKFRNEEIAKCQELESDKVEEYLEGQIKYYTALFNLCVTPSSIKTKENEEYLDAYNELKDQLSIELLEQKKAVVEELLATAQYEASYHENILNIKAKASQMTEISLFAKKDSFAYKEIQKSVKDYEPLENISVELGNDKVITSVFDFQLIHYLLFAFAIVIISQFLEERKLGLWSIVHTKKNGRFILAIKRIGILFLGVSFITILSYSILFGMSCKFYGEPSFSRMIQSVPEFGDFIIPASTGMFIVIFIITKILALLITALLIWFVMSIIKSRNVAILSLGLIFGIEYGCFRFIAPQGYLNLFKYVNIFYYIDPSDWFSYYRNLRFIKILIGRLELMYAALIILPIIFMVLCIFVNARKHPVKSPGKLEKLMDHSIMTMQRPFELLPPWLVEFHKSFIWQKGLIILSIFVYMAFTGIKDIGYTYQQSKSNMKTFCETYGGELSQTTLDYVESKQAEYDKAAEDYKEGTQQFKNGTIDQKQLERLQNINDSYSEKRNTLLDITKKITYVKSQIEQGYDAHLIDDTSYTKLFGKLNYSVNNLISIKIIFLMILILSGIFSFERKSNTVAFLRSLPKGRQNVFRMKLFVSIAVTVGLWALYYGIQLYEFYHNYGFTYLDAPLRSIQIMKAAPINCEIGTFLIILYVTRLIMLLCIAFIIMMISAFMTMEQSLITSLIICLMPSVMIYVGIDLFKKLSVTVPVNFIENFSDSKGFDFIIPIIVLLVLGTIGIIVSYRKWCNYVNIDYKKKINKGGK